MLTHLGVQNLRGYNKELQYVDLQKINLLVGKNSSGKSTFLRLLPLLKQSLETETLAPILWFGKYVDFGDISTVKNYHLKNEPVSFNFKITLLKENLKLSNYYPFFDGDDEKDELIIFYNNLTSNMPEKINVEIELSIVSEMKYGVSLKWKNYELYYELLDNKVKKFLVSCNDVCLDFSESFRLIRRDKSLFPSRFFIEKQVAERSLHYKYKNSGYGYYFPSQFRVLTFFWDQLNKEVTKNYQRIPEKLGAKIVNIDFSLDKENMINLFSNNRKILSLLTKDSDFTNRLHACLFGAISENLLEHANESIIDYFLNVQYVGPIRANSDRYYRYQGVQVNELDHTGSNLPMILQSLHKREREELSDWTLENLQFSIRLVLKDQHYAVEIRSIDDDYFHNITDMGFGYSQILPIAVAIWFETRTLAKKKKTNRQMVKERTKVFAVEQPELHLHPAMQYQFGKMVAKLIQISEGLNISVVLETHSKAIIDAISNQIYRGFLSKECVSINIFAKNRNHNTVITKASFDEEGYLVNWPAGFLSAGE